MILAASFARVRSEIYGLFVMYSTISSKFEIYSSEMQRHPLFKLIDMSNQVRILVGTHTDFSLFVTNPALIRVLRTNFDEVSDFEYPNSIPRPSSKKTGYRYCVQTPIFY